MILQSVVKSCRPIFTGRIPFFRMDQSYRRGRRDHGDRFVRRQPDGHRQSVRRDRRATTAVLPGPLLKWPGLGRVPRQSVGSGSATPSLLGGTDYAWGGAATGDGLAGRWCSQYRYANQHIPGIAYTYRDAALHALGRRQRFPRLRSDLSLHSRRNIGNEITTSGECRRKAVDGAQLPLLGNLPATNTLPQSDRDALNELSRRLIVAALRVSSASAEPGHQYL